ncbi:MAG: cation-efflux pump [Solirubrobacterales bacterium]|nr:cation-efflux pump [Solirubrobacterales bacterium]
MDVPQAEQDEFAVADATAARAQVRTASFSVVAACFLVAVKLIAGIISGSLGLLAEAAHSGTDLVAALLTLFALRVAMRPADQEHQYGHGKAQHLAALGESAFLALVSAFIGYQALARLTGGSQAHAVDVRWWVLAILGVVIVVDASRATLSMRAARRYDSPALAANALHFASDLAGSVAVLVGLVFVSAGYESADSVAALVVAVLVIVAAVRLASDSVDVLMDRAPADAHEHLSAALAALDGGVQVERVRMRQAAGRSFVDVVVGVAPDAGITQAHATADEIEATVREALPTADVVVHVEPLDAAGDLRERATAAALGIRDVREVHNVRVMNVSGGYELSLHVKLPSDLTLDRAHEIVTTLEQAISDAVPELSQIFTHIEPLAQIDWTVEPSPVDVEVERDLVDTVVKKHTGAAPLEVFFRDADRGRVAFITVALPGEQPLRVAHRRTGLIEADIRHQRPELADVVVHTEPAPKSP